ncbi:MAG TPA: ABC transporter permease subunit, partial [Pirellulales bacterium]|nr:ABC transporter permease subunit [Pirellulales bacterium]
MQNFFLASGERRSAFWLALASLLGAVVAASQPGLAAEVALSERLSGGVLRWGGDAEGGAPFELRDPHHPSRVIGFEVELADALAELLSKKLGGPIRAEFVQYEWDTLLPGLENSDFDIILSGYEITPERRSKVLFTRPYYIYAQQLVVRADDHRIRSLADCQTLPVGTLAGSAAERLLIDRGLRHIVTFSGQVEPYLDLELGRLDAVLLDTPIVTYYAASNPKLKSVGPAIGHGEYGIGLRQDDRALAAALDEALERLITDGRLRTILARWHLWNAEQVQLAAGPQREAQLHGLGFDADGKPLPGAGDVPDAVDRNIIAASAQLWTFDQYAPLLLSAAGMTVALTVASMSLAVWVGMIVALVRLYGPGPTRRLALAYVEFFRGIPMLLVLFFLYFG